MVLGFLLEPERFRIFFRAFFADLKTSRRFQVAFVLWIPLFVTVLILAIRFGWRNTLAEKYHEWGTTFIQEGSITYPDVQINGPNMWLPTNSICQTVFPPVQTVQFGACDMDFIPHWGPQTCKKIILSSVTTSNTPVYGNPIRCFLQFNNTGQNMNDELYMFTPGGWQPGQNWNFFRNYIRPNQQIGIHLSHQYFYPMNSAPLNIWSADVNYESSIFVPGTSTAPFYNVTIYFRIPDGFVQASWETVGFDRWFLIACWGGGIFFVYFLHKVVFSLLKFILPKDSTMLKEAPATVEYTPLK